DFHQPRLRRQLDEIRGRNDLELNQEIREIDVCRRLVDDDAHRAFRGMRANVDHAAAEAFVPHRRHGDQHLSVEITSTGSLPSLLRNPHEERLPDPSCHGNSTYCGRVPPRLRVATITTNSMAGRRLRTSTSHPIPRS